MDNCAYCYRDNICVTCAENYYLVDNTCVLCLEPCKSCYANGTCRDCVTGFSQVGLLSTQLCFLCNADHCTSCSFDNPFVCLQCDTGYTYNSTSNQCMQDCPVDNCFNCVNSTFCRVCSAGFFLNSTNGSCSQCDGGFSCSICNGTTPACTKCASKFYLSENQGCMPCPSYCMECTSATNRTEVVTPGYTLVMMDGMGMVGKCDYGCMSCSGMNPGFCYECMDGFYLMSRNNSDNTFRGSMCAPCTLASKCRQCSPAAPAVCLACWPNDFMTNTSTCISCMDPCTSCSSTDASFCTSCPSGYSLSAGVCSEIPAVNVTVCDANCLNCDVSGNFSVCLLCRNGYVSDNGKCVPCVVGCSICSIDLVEVFCVSCSVNTYMTSGGDCVSCTGGCESCTANGCTSCMEGYKMTSTFTCVTECNWPCASCTEGKPSTCTSCFYGWTYSSGSNSCSSDLSCNSDDGCSYCPTGYVRTNTDMTTANASCSTCSASANCQRCSPTNVSECTSCYSGAYLNPNGQCVSCPTGCESCVSLALCFSCMSGYVSMEAPRVINNENPHVHGMVPVTCMACESPCSTCYGDARTCSSCVSGYSYVRGKCISEFSFIVDLVLNTSALNLRNNYFAFLTEIATMAETDLNALAIFQIGREPNIQVVMMISTIYLSGSEQATAQQMNLNALFESGTIANVSVTSFILQTSSLNTTCSLNYCTKCKTLTECETCSSGYNLINGSCIYSCPIENCNFCNPDRTCGSCANDTVPSLQGTSCIACSVDGCSKCLSSNACSLCNDGLILSGNGSAAVCITCQIENCVQCSANNTCAMCAGSFKLQNNTCSLCAPPCMTCNVDGSCLTCLPPFSPVTLSTGQRCFTCQIDFCSSCSSANATTCTTCQDNYQFNSTSGACEATCADTCKTCCPNCLGNDGHLCSACIDRYYLQPSNSTCSRCPGAPQCITCDPQNPDTCTACSSGFFLSSGSCTACPTGCSQCDNANKCTQLGEGGKTIITEGNTTFIAVCNSGCSECSSSDPGFCSACEDGFYLSTSNTTSICLPCSATSNCMTCSASSPAVCLSCWPNAFLQNSTCQSCAYPCATCETGTTATCTSCFSGFVLNNSQCA